MNEDVLDAIAEVTNMIIGNVKSALEEKVGAMGLSTPTVIFGRNFQTRSARTHEWTGVRFRSGEHDMYKCPSRQTAKIREPCVPGFSFHR